MYAKYGMQNMESCVVRVSIVHSFMSTGVAGRQPRRGTDGDGGGGVPGYTKSMAL